MTTFFQKYFGKKAKYPLTAKPKMVLLLDHAETGKWYGYEIPLQMPAQRLLAIETATRFQEMGVTREYLTQTLATMKALANKGKIVDLFTVITELETRVALIVEFDTLASIASCFYVRDGEDPKTHDETQNAEKIALWKKYPELGAFFLENALPRIERCSNYSWEITRQYMAETAATLRLLDKNRSRINSAL